MDYQAWEATVPVEIRQDALWQIDVYRLGVFAAELAWADITRLIDDPRAWSLVDPLHRAVGSISAHVAEGYSMGTAKNRARYYEYALGSARESRDWYYQSRHLLGEPVTRHRLKFLAQIIRLLLTRVPRRPPARLGEAPEPDPIHPLSQIPLDLLQHIPLPEEYEQD